jgi:hypothetical protein
LELPELAKEVTFEEKEGKGGKYGTCSPMSLTSKYFRVSSTREEGRKILTSSIVWGGRKSSIRILMKDNKRTKLALRTKLLTIRDQQRISYQR